MRPTTSPLPSATEFAGFPTSARATPVPNLFFARLFPRIERPEELLVTLYFFYAQTQRHRSPAFVTRRELAADHTLVTALAHLCADDGAALDRGLALAVERGSLLRVEARGDGRSEELYLLATPHNRKAAEEMSQAELRLDEPLPPALPEESPSIYSLYEENIGAITPLIADDLKDADERYPPRWIAEAFREAVSLNKRNWRYISSILNRWEAEGPDYEEAGRNPEADWLERRYSRGKRPARPGGSRP
ncbi:MAG: DnaD domain protein [Dehalococcoidia bacterium]